MVDDFQEASGINLRHVYDGAEIGKAVEKVRRIRVGEKPFEVLEREAKQLQKYAADMLRSVENVRKALPKTEASA